MRSLRSPRRSCGCSRVDRCDVATRTCAVGDAAITAYARDLLPPTNQRQGPEGRLGASYGLDDLDGCNVFQGGISTHLSLGEIQAYLDSSGRSPGRATAERPRNRNCRGSFVVSADPRKQRALKRRTIIDRRTLYLRGDSRTLLSYSRFSVAVYVIVFSLGTALFGTVMVLGARLGSEEFLALVALVSYGSYVVSSAALSITIWAQTKTRWLAMYLGVMFPYILLVSWTPIAASWTEALAWNSDGLRIAAIIGNNAILAAVTAVVLLELTDLPFVRSRLRPLTTIVSVLVPISLWMAQVALVLHTRSL